MVTGGTTEQLTRQILKLVNIYYNNFYCLSIRLIKQIERIQKFLHAFDLLLWIVLLIFCFRIFGASLARRAVSAMPVAGGIVLFRFVAAAAIVAARFTFYLVVNDYADGNRKGYAKHYKQYYIRSAHACPPSLRLRFKNFSLPLLLSTISVTTAATTAAQMNTVHHHAPIVYTAALVT